MLSSIRALACFLACGATVFAACGGKTTTELGDAGGDAAQVPPPTPSGSASDASSGEPFDAGGGRTCTSTCAQPHQCCEVSCGGLPVATPTSCCTCLSNEVSSLVCPNNKCGG
ncbi:MAG TPA: hypothetical protein VGH28_13270 [Polyangiaceae bacterium]|jgi:hypothetical protein